MPGKRSIRSVILSSSGPGFDDPCWQPPADIYRSSRGWLVKVDLAGVRPGDVRVEVAGNTLRVWGERRDWLRREGHRVYSLEIRYSSFERRLELPEDLERARLRWSFEEGMLLIEIDVEDNQ